MYVYFDTYYQSLETYDGNMIWLVNDRMTHYFKLNVIETQQSIDFLNYVFDITI